MKRADVNRDPERARARAVSDFRTAAAKLAAWFREAAPAADSYPLASVAADLEAMRETVQQAAEAARRARG